MFLGLFAGVLMVQASNVFASGKRNRLSDLDDYQNIKSTFINIQSGDVAKF